MLRNTGATVCAIATRDLPVPKLVIHIFFCYTTYCMSMDQDGNIFVLFHDSFPTPNCTNIFFYDKKARQNWQFTSSNSKHTKVTQFFIRLFDRAHAKQKRKPHLYPSVLSLLFITIMLSYT